MGIVEENHDRSLPTCFALPDMFDLAWFVTNSNT